jgi:antirestriction protein ArdC
VAEISAAYVCASLGIVPTVRHADYIAAWLQILREDERAIVRAASHASKAADWLLGRLALAEESAETAGNDGDGAPIPVATRETQHMQGRAA